MHKRTHTTHLEPNWTKIHQLILFELIIRHFIATSPSFSCNTQRNKKEKKKKHQRNNNFWVANSWNKSNQRWSFQISSFIQLFVYWRYFYRRVWHCPLTLHQLVSHFASIFCCCCSCFFWFWYKHMFHSSQLKNENWKTKNNVIIVILICHYCYRWLWITKRLIITNI